MNAFSSPVDVLIDGEVIIASLPAGIMDTAPSTIGDHMLVLRQSGRSVSMSQSITTTAHTLSTIAVVRASNGAVASAMLDDTNSVVSSGATKVRVLHFQAQPNSVSAPFYQSTVGTWEVRVWQVPADASGWENAPIRIVLPLESGQKRTILLLDKPGGGVRAELL